MPWHPLPYLKVKVRLQWHKGEETITDCISEDEALVHVCECKLVHIDLHTSSVGLYLIQSATDSGIKGPCRRG